MAKKRKSLGLGFPDEVAKVITQGSRIKKESAEWVDFLLPNFRSSDQQMNKKSTWAVTVFVGFCLILFFIIFLRLFHLQIVKGHVNKELADSNRIQVKVIHAPRGVIYDRNGTILAANSPAFRFIDPDTRKSRLITREQALEWEVMNDPASPDLEVDNVRNYPLGEKFAHVVGFTGEISGDQLNSKEYEYSSFSNKNYRQGDRIGKMGVEAQAEKVLRGKDGGEII